MTSAEQFLRMLAEHGGTIVSTAALTPEQIAIARGENRMLVLDNGLGFVWKRAIDDPCALVRAAAVAEERDRVLGLTRREIAEWDQQATDAEARDLPHTAERARMAREALSILCGAIESGAKP